MERLLPDGEARVLSSEMTWSLAASEAQHRVYLIQREQLKYLDVK